MGRIFTNPVSGERIEIISSTPDLLVFELFLPPGTSVPARHVHPQQQERFTVLEGELRFSIGRRTVNATVGDTITVKQGVAHWFGNRGSHRWRKRGWKSNQRCAWKSCSRPRNP